MNEWQELPLWLKIPEAILVWTIAHILCLIGWTFGSTIILWDQLRGVRMKHPVTFAPGWEGHEGDGRSW